MLVHRVVSIPKSQSDEQIGIRIVLYEGFYSVKAKHKKRLMTPPSWRFCGADIFKGVHYLQFQ